MRHCVRLEILLGKESEFSRNGVRMREIWSSEVSQTFRIENSSKIRIQNPRTGWAGKFPPMDQVDLEVDHSVDLPGARSTIVSTWVLTLPDQVDHSVDLGVDLLPKPSF